MQLHLYVYVPVCLCITMYPGAETAAFFKKHPTTEKRAGKHLMSSNNQYTFILTIEKSNDEDVRNLEIESLLKSLLEKGSFLRVRELIKTGSMK